MVCFWVRSYPKWDNSCGLFVLERDTVLPHTCSTKYSHTYFAAYSPPKAVFKKIISLFANSFWGQGEDDLKCHWVKWDQYTFPTQEIGLGIRKMEEVMLLELKGGGFICISINVG